MIPLTLEYAVWRGGEIYYDPIVYGYPVPSADGTGNSYCIQKNIDSGFKQRQAVRKSLPSKSVFKQIPVFLL